MVINMPKLYYLDDRPIFEIERLCADAFARGGKEEEDRVREEFKYRQAHNLKTQIERDRKWEEDGKIAHKAAFSQMLNDLKEKRPDLVSEHEKLEKTYEKDQASDSVKVSQLLKLRKHEDQLKNDWYKHLKEKGEAFPTHILGKPKILSSKEFQDEQAAIKKREVEINKREKQLID
jgi:hypothetical protein